MKTEEAIKLIQDTISSITTNSETICNALNEALEALEQRKRHEDDMK